MRSEEVVQVTICLSLCEFLFSSQFECPKDVVGIGLLLQRSAVMMPQGCVPSRIYSALQ